MEVYSNTGGVQQHWRCTAAVEGRADLLRVKQYCEHELLRVKGLSAVSTYSPSHITVCSIRGIKQ